MSLESNSKEKSPPLFNIGAGKETRLGFYTPRLRRGRRRFRQEFISVEEKIGSILI